MRSIALCFLAACVAPLDDEPGDPLASTESAIWDGGDYDDDGEVVVIEGSIDPCWDAGLCWVGVGGEHPIDPGDTGGYGGGGGGGGSGSYEPQPKDCLAEKDKIACEQCCDWNTEKVDRPACKKRYRNDRKERQKCFQRAENQNRQCIESCKGLHIFEAIH